MRYFLLVFLLSTLSLRGQFINYTKIDSLKNIAKNSDVSYASILYNKIGEELMDFKKNEAIENFNKSIDLALKSNNRHCLFINYNDLGNIYCDESKYEIGLEFYKKGLLYADKNEDKQTLFNNLVSTYSDLNDLQKCNFYLSELRKVCSSRYSMVGYFVKRGLYFGKQGDYSSFGLMLDSAKTIVEKEKLQSKNDSDNYANYYHMAAMYYTNMGRYDNEAFEVNEKLLRIAENSGVPLYLKTAYSNKANLFYNQQRYFKALEWYKKSLAMSLNSEQNTTISEGYINVGGTFEQLGILDSALYYNKKGLEYGIKSKDSVYIIVSMLNIASAYAKMDSFKQTEAILAPIEQNILNFNQNEMTLSYYIVYGVIKASLKEYERAKVLINIGLHYQAGIRKPDILAMAYKTLSAIYEKENKMDSSLLCLKIYNEFTDTVRNINVINSADMAEAKYSVDKIKQENGMLDKINNKLSNRVKWVIILSMGLITIGSFFFIKYRRRADQKLKRSEQNVQLEREEKKNESRKALINEGFVIGKLQPNHVLAGLLNDIYILVDLGEKEIAKQKIKDLTNFNRLLIHQQETNKNTINDEFENIKVLLAYESKSRSFSYNIEIEEKLIPILDKVEIPKLIFYVPIYNAIEYAIGYEKNGKIEISLSSENNMLKFVIVDNGKKSLKQSSIVDELRGIGTKLMDRFIGINKRLTEKDGHFEINSIIIDGVKIGNESKLILPVEVDIS